MIIMCSKTAVCCKAIVMVYSNKIHDYASNWAPLVFTKQLQHPIGSFLCFHEECEKKKKQSIAPIHYDKNVIKDEA